MRRSGSSSCLLRPRSSLSSEDLKKMGEEPPLTVTMVNTTRLPAYSTERYYMLSELEQNASSVKFLCDMADRGAGTDGSGGGEAAAAAHELSPRGGGSPPTLPPYVMLYVLWRPNTYPSPRSFVEGPVMDYARRILELGGDDASALLDQTPSPPSSPTSSPLSGAGAGAHATMGMARRRRSSLGRTRSGLESRTKIYLVVDRLSSKSARRDSLPPGLDLSEATESEQEQQQDVGTEATRRASQSVANDDIRERQHKVETQTSEDVAKAVSTNPALRPIVEGVSVGTTSEVRAAPGLETCLEAVGYLSSERRRAARYLIGRNLPMRRSSDEARKKAGGDDTDPTRSPICLVAPHPDDLVGLDPEGETDAVQGVIQSRTVSEWNGNGNAICFAGRAMDGWRKYHGVESPTSASFNQGSSARSIRRKRRAAEEEEDLNGYDVEDLAETMVVAFLIAVAAFLWTRYRDSFWGALAKLFGHYGESEDG